MEYTDENVWASNVRKMRCDKLALKWHKAFCWWPTITDSRQLVWLSDVYRRYDWKISDKPSYGIGNTEWELAEIATPEELTLIKLRRPEYNE